ncbi:MAG: serine hydrolase [Acidobacteria bacterium]|nr:serine hydrolase [Acidobacteriota bacterium]
MIKRTAVLLSVFVALSFPLKGEIFTFRVCHIPDTPWQTKVLIVNPGPENLLVQFHHIKTDGTENHSPMIVLSPGGSTTLKEETMGTGGMGWLRCVGEVSPAVILSYRYGDTKSICRFTLAADKTGTKWLLPLPAEGPSDWYGIAAANFGENAVDLTIEGIKNGYSIEQTTISIGTGEKLVDTLAHFFREMTFLRPEWLLITSSLPIPAPVGIAGNSCQDRHLFFTGQTVSPESEAQARWAIPHVAESNWDTSVDMINPDSSLPRKATLYRLYKTPCARPLADISLPPLQVRTFDLGKTGEPGPLIVNSRKPLVALLHYHYKGSPSVCSFFLHNQWSREWILPDSKENWLNWHGIAIGNPLSVPIEIILTAVGPDGPVATATRTVAPGSKWVGLAWQWFSDDEETAPDLSTVAYFMLQSDIQLSEPLLIAGNNAQDRHVFLPGIPVEKPDTFTKDGPALAGYWPTGGWRACRPEETGMDSAKLREARDYAANPAINTQGLLVIREGYVVAEQYFQGYDRNSIFESFSVAKSFSSCLIGISLDRGWIPDLDMPIYTVFPQWQQPDTPAIKKRITLRHLLTMTSGLRWNLDAPDYDLASMIASDDYLAYMLVQPMVHEPGTYWEYSSGGSALLSGIIHNTTGLSAEELANQYLFPQIGFKYAEWESDGAGNTATAWGLYTTLRQFAKFGYLYMNGGNWNENQVVPENYVVLSGQPVSASIDWYGFQWWLTPSLVGYENANLPDNLMIAWGKYTQQIFVMPDQHLLVLRFGHDLYSTTDQWDEVEFLKLILDAIKE